MEQNERLKPQTEHLKIENEIIKVKNNLLKSYIYTNENISKY